MKPDEVMKRVEAHHRWRASLRGKSPQSQAKEILSRYAHGQPIRTFVSIMGVSRKEAEGVLQGLEKEGYCSIQRHGLAKLWVKTS